jgi:hypothetical protein
MTATLEQPMPDLEDTMTNEPSTANEHVKAQNRAARRAMKRLRERHEDEYATIYVEEALAEGVMPRTERKRILADMTTRP